MYLPVKQKTNRLLSGREKIAKYLIISYYYLLNILLGFIINIFILKYKNEKVNKILILRIGGMGDTITILPVFTGLKKIFPDAKIDLLTNQPSAGRNNIVEMLPEGYFSSCFYYKKFVDKDIIKNLRMKKYDLYLELPTYASFYFELRSVLVSRLINARYGAGWHVSSSKFLKKYQERIFWFDSNHDRQQNILKDYGICPAEAGYLFEENNIPLPDYSVAGITEKLKSDKAIAIIPGAGRSQNVWPLKSFEIVTKYFLEKGYLILVVGGEKDFETGQYLTTSERIINMCGKLSVLQYASLMSNCLLAISNDTGPMHLAYASGIPVVAIFSDWDYSGKWYPPPSSKNIVLKNPDVPCATCFSNRCRNNICMQSISPDEVIRAAEHLLKTAG